MKLLKQPINLNLRPQEYQVIMALRDLEYGSIEVKVQDGIPVISEVRKKVKLTD